MKEFGEKGFAEVSTETIAERAGVSQPYIFRLFGTKKDLIIEAIRERSVEIRENFREAAENPGDLSPLDSMGEAYIKLLTEDPSALRCQLHAWAAASDPEIGAVARETYLDIWRDVITLSDEDPETVRNFIAYGMLLTVGAALDIPEICGDPAFILDKV